MSDWVRRVSVPDNEAGITVPINATLADDGQTALWLGHLVVFATSFQACLTAFARTPGDDGQGAAWGMPPRSGRSLMLGVELADGRRASSLDALAPGETALDQLTVSLSGGGSLLRCALTAQVSPLPSPGPLRFVWAWPARDIDEGMLDIAAEPIIEAAQRSRELWPWARTEPQRPSAPQPPPGGWFDRR